jgi:hypothetical protein
MRPQASDGESRPPVARDRTVIFGLYKTGTTALFHNIRNSLPHAPRLLYEARRFVPEPADPESGVLAKVIVGDENVDHASFMQFEKKVVIVRDPRDWLISGCLFLTQEIERIYLDSAAIDDIVNSLREKESAPRQFPFSLILEKVLAYSSLGGIDAFLAWADTILDTLIDFEARLGAGFRISYEDFVDRRVTRLSRYLGIVIGNDISMGNEFTHVARSATYGNWKSWFTKEDVELLAPVFRRFLEHYGYDTRWQLDAQPTLEPALGSGYVMRVVERKRQLSGLDGAAK